MCLPEGRANTQVRPYHNNNLFYSDWLGVDGFGTRPYVVTTIDHAGVSSKLTCLKGNVGADLCVYPKDGRIRRFAPTTIILITDGFQTCPYQILIRAHIGFTYVLIGVTIYNSVI